jgi:hypothetical protein
MENTQRIEPEIICVEDENDQPAMHTPPINISFNFSKEGNFYCIFLILNLDSLDNLKLKREHLRREMEGEFSASNWDNVYLYKQKISIIDELIQLKQTGKYFFYLI